MSAAGAQTTHCYSFKLTGSGCTCTGVTGDPSCFTYNGSTFESAIAATGAVASCPPAGTITSLSACDDSGKIDVRSGCTIEYVGVRRGGPDGGTATCTTFCALCGAQSVDWTNPAVQGISHLNVVICCTS